jgi:hypothetical protein
LEPLALDAITPAQLSHRVLVLLFDYWDRLRGDRPAPARLDIDPVEIPRQALPDILLTEVVRAPGARRYRFRLVGSRVVELAGRDPSRQFLDEVLPMAFGYRDYIIRLYDTIDDAREPLYSRSSYITYDTSQPPERETHRLMLPLLDGDGALTHVLAAQVFHVHRGVTQKPFLAPDEVVYGDTLLVRAG